MISSHAFAPYCRLLWKEFRAQRALWLAMIAAGVALQILSWMVFRIPRDMEMSVWAMSTAIPFLTLIGAVAILFAGEREEQTCDWLVRLSAPPIWVLMAKWSFVIASTLLTCLLLAISAFFISRQMPGESSEVIYNRAIALMQVLLGVLVFGSLGSLLSRRVVTSVPAMFFWWIVTFIGPISIVSWLYWSTPGHDYYIWSASLVVVLVVDLVLGWRWSQGKFVDVSVLQGLSSLRDRIAAASIHRFLPPSARISRLSTRAENPSVSGRAWQRFIWQERHRERFHNVLLWSGCAIGFGLSVVTAIWSVPWTILLVPYVAVLPFIVGILGFRHEAEGQPLQFLANRGIAPMSLWWAKHVVWLPRAFGLFLGVLALACCTERALFQPQPGVAVINALGIELTHHVGAVAWFVLLTYGCGHLAAMLVRRIVLSVVLGTVLCFMAMAWLSVMLTLQVPTWWSVGGVAVWLFGLGAWYVLHWGGEARSNSLNWRLAACAFVPLAILFGITATWRVAEVPEFGSNWAPFVEGQTEEGYSPRPGPDSSVAEVQKAWVINSKEANLEIHRLSTRLTDDDWKTIKQLSATVQGFNNWTDLRGFVPEGEDPNEVLRPENQEEEPLKRRFLAINADRIKQVLEATQSESAWVTHLDSPPRQIARRVVKDIEISKARTLEPGWSFEDESVTWSRPRIPQIDLLENTAQVLTEAGDLDRALDHYIAALRLANYWAARGSLSGRWRDAAISHQLTYAKILAWANHPDQSVPRLLQALGRVQMEVGHFPLAAEAVVAEYLGELKWLDETVSERWTRSTQQAGDDRRPWHGFLADTSRFFPWEVVRARYVLKMQLVFTKTFVNELLYFMANSPGADIPRITDSSPTVMLSNTEEYQRYVYTTPLLYNGVSLTKTQLEHVDGIIQHETAAREIQLALALLVWKRKHDRWPAGLQELLNVSHGSGPNSRAILPISLVDPWSGRIFEYRGSSPVQKDPSTGNETLLFSVGPNDIRVVYRNANDANAIRTNWRGERRNAPGAGIYDDRFRLDLVDGTLVMRSPFQDRLPD